MARNIKTFHQLRQQATKKRMMQKQQQYKENTTRLYPTNRPQNNSKRIKAELLKFQVT
jgi:hypothetical protein